MVASELSAIVYFQKISRPPPRRESQIGPPPPTRSDFPFAQGNVNPSPPLEFSEKYHPPPTPSGKFFPSFKRIQELINTKSKSHVSMGIHLIIYFINDLKAALSERRELAQTNINSISLHKIMPKTYTILSTLGGVSH